MNFQELDEYLSKEYSGDYWSDYAVLYAIELVQNMNLADWDTLKSRWRDRSSQWQERCAEILSDADSLQAIPLLLEMLPTPDDELTLTAADSLRSLGVPERDLYLSPDVIKRLRSLFQNSPADISKVE